MLCDFQPGPSATEEQLSGCRSRMARRGTIGLQWQHPAAMKEALAADHSRARHYRHGERRTQTCIALLLLSSEGTRYSMARHLCLTYAAVEGAKH